MIVGLDADLLARAGVGRPSIPTGRHPIEILTARAKQETDGAAATEGLPALFAEAITRIAQAVEILETFVEDDEARQGALDVLRGEAA